MKMNDESVYISFNVVFLILSDASIYLVQLGVCRVFQVVICCILFEPFGVGVIYRRRFWRGAEEAGWYPRIARQPLRCRWEKYQSKFPWSCDCRLSIANEISKKLICILSWNDLLSDNQPRNDLLIWDKAKFWFFVMSRKIWYAN